MKPALSRALRRIREWAVFYPTLASEMGIVALHPKLRWWNAVDETVVLGALPFERVVRSLHREGVRQIINMCEEFPGPVSLYEQLGIKHLRLPTRDFTSPSRAAIAQAFAFLQEAKAVGEKVYVHCKAGRGRSATVVLCWLAKTRGIELEKAQNELCILRPQVNRTLYQRLEAVDFVKNRRT